MHSLVRNLYKRFILVGRDYPHPDGIDFVRRRVKKAFREHKDVEDQYELRKRVHIGRYVIKELIAVVQIKKYRTMKKRYYERETEVHPTTKALIAAATDKLKGVKESEKKKA